MTGRGLALLVLVGATVATGGVLVLGRGNDYTVRAEFDNAAGLHKDFAVKIAGVRVGKVADVRLERGDRAVAELTVDRDAAPVGRDVRADIRPSNLLGEKYVELTPGDVGHPAPSGTLIPHSRTSAPTELDDVLDVLDQPTRFALGASISEQGRALVGRGRDLAAMLVRMPPALDRTRELVAGLGRDNRALGRLVTESDRILAAVGPQHRSLGRLVVSAGGALDALASRRRALGETVRRAPATISQVRRSLVELQRAAVPLGPAAEGLRATAPSLTAILHELPPFTAAARPTLRTGRAVAPTLSLLGRRATPVVRRLGPAGSELATFAAALDPATVTLDESIADTLGLMEGWARTIQNRDAAGHVFRVGVALENSLINRLREQYILGERPRTRWRGARHAADGVEAPSVTAPKPPSSAAVPNVRLPQPKLPAVKAPPLPTPALPPGVPPPSGVLDYLLGP